MPQRSVRGRVVIGAQVLVHIPQDAEVLEYMGLFEAESKPLKGVRMIGEVKSNHGKASWVVYLTAAEKTYHFVKDVVHLAQRGYSGPRYYCVVDEEVQTIDGLILPTGAAPAGYHLSHAAAQADLAPKKKSRNSSINDSQTTATNTAAPSSTVSPIAI
jgi:hypothetical protein